MHILKCWLQETEVHITYDDQQKINKFARLNAKYEDFKEEIQGKKVMIILYNSFDLTLEYKLLSFNSRASYRI